MKRIYTFLLIVGCLSVIQSYAAQTTASIAIENPRIVGSNFYFDIYFMRTNDVDEWYVGGDPTLDGKAYFDQSSWVFDMNTTAFDGSIALSYENPTYIQSNYTTSIQFVGATNVVDVTCDNDTRVHFPENVWIHLFTVEMGISSGIASGIYWDLGATGLIDPTNQSVTETDFDSDCDIALNTNCWTGVSSNKWDDAGNWSSGSVPSGEDIIYPANPQIDFAGFLAVAPPTPYGTVGNMRINHNAHLVLPANTGLTVTGGLVLKGGTLPNIVLSGNMDAASRTSSFIVSGTISNDTYIDLGHIEVHRPLYYPSTTSTAYYHHQVAAPVSGAVLDDWDMIPGNSYAYEFQPDQTWWNIYAPSRLTPSGYGFILSLYDISGTQQDVVFYDNLVLSDYVGIKAVTAGAGNYTLVGNPYTAPIDWNSMYPKQSGLTATIEIWDPSAQGYKYYVSGTGGTSPSAQFIQPGQAFFVEALDGSASTVDFYLADRTHTVEDFLKSTTPNLLRIYTEGGNNSSDVTAICLKDGEVTGGFDLNHDAKDWPSLLGDEATELWTVGTDNENLGVDSRPLSPDQMSVPLSFKAGVEAEYTIGAEEETLLSFSPGTEIFLEDLFLPEQGWIDLKEFQSYSFNASPEDDYARFMLHFHVQDFGIDEIGQNAVTIFSERTDAIIKNNSEQKINEIQVYDIAGNLMTAKSGVTEDVIRMYVSDNTGYYIVKVITDKAVYSEKVLISK